MFKIILSPPILPPIIHIIPDFDYIFPQSCWENQNIKLYNLITTYILTPQFFVLLHDLNDCMRRFTKDKKVCAGQCCWNKKTLYSLKGCVILHSYLQHKWIVYTSILLSSCVTWFLSSFINRLSTVIPRLMRCVWQLNGRIRWNSHSEKLKNIFRKAFWLCYTSLSCTFLYL